MISPCCFTPDVYFVRHGEYDALADGVPLSVRGREQAETAGKKLAAMAIRPVCVFSSSLNRAATTAELIAQQLDCSPPVVSDELWVTAMAPHKIPDLDAFLDNIATGAGMAETPRHLVVVTHEELMRELPAAKNRLAVGFCEITPYKRGTWERPLGFIR